MGQISKDIMSKANIIPRLRLGLKTEKGVQTTGKHHVTLLEEKLVEGKDFQGNVVPKVRYIFQENGEKKRYEAPLKNKEGTEPHYFVQSMSEVNEGDEIILEMVKKGMKNVILVQKVGVVNEVEAEEGDVSLDDIE